MPKFSIIIPAYNVEQYIITSLESVYAQTFKDFEVICVDDGSTDRTVEFIKKADYPNLRLICNDKHLGPGESRNIALSRADGKYIVCVDADDVAGKTLLQSAYDILEFSNVSAVWTKFNIFWEEEGKITSMYTFPILKNQPEGFLKLGNDNISDFPAYSWNKIFRRELINNEIFWSHDLLFEDVEFYYRYYTQNPNIYIIDKPLYLYRRRQKSIISNVVNDKFSYRDLFYVIENIYHYLVKQNLFEQYKKALLRLLMNSIHEFDNLDYLKKDLAKTVNQTLSNINFPMYYEDLKKDKDLYISLN